MALRFSEIVPKVAGGHAKRGDTPPTAPVAPLLPPPPRSAAAPRPRATPLPAPVRAPAAEPAAPPADDTDRLVDAFLAEATAAPEPVALPPTRSARGAKVAAPLPATPEPAAPPTAERDRIADALLAADHAPGPGRPTESIQLPAVPSDPSADWGSSTQEIAEELLKAAGGAAATRGSGSTGTLARMLSAALADEPEASEDGTPAPARPRAPATVDPATLPPAERWKALAAGLIAELEASFRTRPRHGPEEETP